METTTLIAWLARVGMLPAAAALIIGAVPARADETVDVTLADKGMQSMRVDLSTEQVKAGDVTFNVTNTSRTLAHEFVVARSDKPIGTLPYNEHEKEVEESALEVVNEIEDIEPGKSGTLTVKLEPGSYILLCNKAGHFKLGMVNHIAVTN
ncbi:copper resistance protein [Mesorhizobium tamadayense]|uniref:Copper resistance protein n=1 Tax=Mesorhizobium tamadayense TaxID=425306 RepID=A0A3P3ESE5_9HYPH|nr:plastocyanin/azurin family copper-binding protein [Mesorhizobium tamadayense]RRH89314.1 copper resistance protein [Mesorhizobium tamadayense]